MKIIFTLVIALIAYNLAAQMAITIPAEYEKNDGVILTWPYEADYDSIVADISALSASSGNVWLLYNPDSTLTDTTVIRTFLQATGNNCENIGFVPARSNTFFIREYGPIMGYGVFDQLLVRYFGDPVFDDYNRPQDDSLPAQLASFYQSDYVQYSLAFEPGNIITDGEKNLFVSTHILEENLPLSQTEVAQQLTAIYNVPNIFFLEAPEHSGGGTMKSLDMFMKLLDSETMLISELPDSLPDYSIIENNVSIIQNIANTYEGSYKIVRVMPAPLDNGKYDTSLSGELRSYTNALIFNDLILIPSYNNPEYDSAAYEAYKNNTYGMDVEMIDVRKLSALHGAVHTITKEKPQEHYLRINHKKVEGAQVYQGDEFTIQCLSVGDNIIDNMWLYYRFNSDTIWQKTMVHLVCPTHYGIIENVQLTDTVHYYLDATMIDGTTITYPLSAPDGFFTFWFDITGTGEDVVMQQYPIIYPNPVTDRLFVKNLDFNGGYHYLISNIEGHIVQEGDVAGEQDIIPVSKLIPGIYFLTLKGARKINSIKFIVQ